jgi:hypothetical protein
VLLLLVVLVLLLLVVVVLVLLLLVVVVRGVVVGGGGGCGVGFFVVTEAVADAKGVCVLSLCAANGHLGRSPRLA